MIVHPGASITVTYPLMHLQSWAAPTPHSDLLLRLLQAMGKPPRLQLLQHLARRQLAPTASDLGDKDVANAHRLVIPQFGT